MRPSMRQAIEGYSEVLREEIKGKAQMEQKRAAGEYSLEQQQMDQQVMEQLVTRLDTRIEQSMERASTLRHTQEKVVDLQRRKQEIMQRLHESLRALDAQREWVVQEGERPVRFVDGQYVWEERMKDEVVSHPLTLGELMTDMTWGIAYSLDPVSVPRQAHKLMAVEVAKTELMKLLNQQIIHEEGSRLDRSSTERSKFGWDIQRHREKIFSQEFISVADRGFLAEQMVQNFFLKLAIDSGLSIQVRSGDIYQDFEQKIDFIIERPAHRRGVDVEATSLKGWGVQLTLIKKGQTLFRRKQAIVQTAKEQLQTGDAVDDIMLVSVPLDDIQKQWVSWCQAGRPPGGPEQYWGSKERQTVFYKVLEGMFEKTTLDLLWNQLREAKTVSLETSFHQPDERSEEPPLSPKPPDKKVAPEFIVESPDQTSWTWIGDSLAYSSDLVDVLRSRFPEKYEQVMDEFLYRLKSSLANNGYPTFPHVLGLLNRVIVFHKLQRIRGRDAASFFQIKSNRISNHIDG